MSIQYTALGFEPMTFQTLVVTHNHYTRAPALTVANLKNSLQLLC